MTLSCHTSRTPKLTVPAAELVTHVAIGRLSSPAACLSNGRRHEGAPGGHSRRALLRQAPRTPITQLKDWPPWPPSRSGLAPFRRGTQGSRTGRERAALPWALLYVSPEGQIGPTRRVYTEIANRYFLPAPPRGRLIPIPVRIRPETAVTGRPAFRRVEPDKAIAPQ